MIYYDTSENTLVPASDQLPGAGEGTPATPGQLPETRRSLIVITNDPARVTEIILMTVEQSAALPDIHPNATRVTVKRGNQ